MVKLIIYPNVWINNFTKNDVWHNYRLKDYALVFRASKAGSRYVTEGAELCLAKASFPENDKTRSRFCNGDTTELTLGSNDLFWFGYVDSNNDDNYTYTYTTSMINKQYNLNFGGHIVQVTDAQPVPLPGAALLLGAGLVGLVGLRRKYNVDS